MITLTLPIHAPNCVTVKLTLPLGLFLALCDEAHAERMSVAEHVANILERRAAMLALHPIDEC